MLDRYELAGSQHDYYIATEERGYIKVTGMSLDDEPCFGGFDIFLHHPVDLATDKEIIVRFNVSEGLSGRKIAGPGFDFEEMIAEAKYRLCHAAMEGRHEAAVLEAIAKSGLSPRWREKEVS